MRQGRLPIASRAAPCGFGVLLGLVVSAGACTPTDYLLGGGAPGSAAGGAGTGGTATAGSAGTTPVFPSVVDVSRGGPGSRVIVGDLSGDGRLDLLSVQGDSGFDDRRVPHAVIALTAYELTGEVLWSLGEVDAEGVEGNSDPPAQIYDLDGDGDNEVLTVMNDELLVLEGATGAVTATHALPDPDAHDLIMIANLTGGARPEDIVLKDRFARVWAYDRDFNPLFAYEGVGGYTLWPYDWDGDGRDELMAGCELLDDDGTFLWSCCDALEGTPDSIYAGDLDGEPANGVEVIVGGGNTLAYRSDGTSLWSFDSVEAQNVALGDFRPDLPGLEVAGLDRVNRTEDEGRDAIFLLSSAGQSLFYEERPPGSGWSTILNAFSNWEGEGEDWILTYRRGTGLPPALLNSAGEVVRTFAEDNALVFPVDVCGDARTELLAYTDTYLEVIEHGDCDLAAEITGTPRPQTKHLYARTRGLSGEYPFQ